MSVVQYKENKNTKQGGFMAIPYLIKITPKDKMREVITEACQTCGRKLETKQEPLRELEISVLTQLFDIASMHKPIKEATLIYDCISQLENLTENDKEIEFTEEDLKFLLDGYNATSWSNERGMVKRPMLWNKECRNLFKQIQKPKTREEWNEENKPVEDNQEVETDKKVD